MITSETGRRYLWHEAKGVCIVDNALEEQVPGDRVRVWVGAERRPAVYVGSILQNKSVPIDSYLAILSLAERN